MPRYRPPKPSDLVSVTWNVPVMGRVRVANATKESAGNIDEQWAPRRSPEDAHLAWKWFDMVPAMREAFIVYAEVAPIAIWSSKLGSPIELSGERYYRLDYLEIDPARRGDGSTAALLFGLIAKRVAEHAATGIVLSAFKIDGLVQAYARLGAEHGCPPGWNHPPELVPLIFRRPALDRLRELIDALQENPSRALS